MKNVLSQINRWVSGGSSRIIVTTMVSGALVGGAMVMGSAISAPQDRIGSGQWYGVPAGEGMGQTTVPVRVVEDAEGLAALFASMNYQLQDVRSGRGVVPAVFLSQIPSDLPEFDSVEQRKSLFFKALLPLVLDVNESIRADRARLEQLANRAANGKSLSTAERLWLARLADRYQLDSIDFARLLHRVDVVPPSLALAQAAIESGWGSSRFAREGHAFFGQKGPAIGDQSGPLLMDGDGALFRSFEDPRDAVRSYIHNLNTHNAYRDLRSHRAEARVKGQSLDGDNLAQFLVRYSERGEDYVKDVRTMIRANTLHDLDDARLEGRPIHVIVQSI
jgi:Bax protein